MNELNTNNVIDVLNAILPYLKNANANYVIIDKDDDVVCFNDGDEPVVYSEKEDAIDNMIDGDKVITEFEYILKKVKFADVLKGGIGKHIKLA